MSDSVFTNLKAALTNGEFRWILFDQLSPELTADLHQFLTHLYKAAPEWRLTEEAQNPDTRHGFSDSECPWMVLDATDDGERSSLRRALKRYLMSYPKKKFLIVGASDLEPFDVPSYLGRGLKLRAEIPVHAKGDDLALLRHSRKLVPGYTLDDLVLGPATRLKFQEALEYIRTNEYVLGEWGFRKRHHRGNGITLIFNGPSGTGKTMAAEVVAHTVGLPLYQIDLSSVVSKWVGETEKNLKAIFHAAAGVKGILLFDEGDAIFGSRTKVEGAQDRYSNLEVSYLLQEIETFNGVAILSTNHEKYLDPAFLRRFTFSIAFGRPDGAQRIQIWKKSIPPELPMGDSVDFEKLAGFPLSGGNIKNCIRNGASRAASTGAKRVEQVDLLWGIKRELQKHGEPFLRELVGEEHWRRVGPEWEALSRS